LEEDNVKQQRTAVVGRLGALAAALMVAAVGWGADAAADARKAHSARLIFPLDALHNHGSCVVETPDGGLLAVWYRGSGERRADDVAILGARLPRGAREWSRPFPMADTPGFPDCNPCVVVDPKGRLRMYWPLIIANEWHTALLMEKTFDRLTREPPRTLTERPVMLKPGPEFTRLVHAAVDADLARLGTTLPPALQEAGRAYLELRRKNSADRYFNRMGWMPRAHPLVLDGTRLIVPLYSDGFDFSLMAITDDWGETWRVSTPLVGAGPVQPALARRRDGTLVAFMRDNGPPPQRVPVSESRDRGETWSPVRDSDQLNPGAGVDVVVLRSGRWALVNNDTERGRHRLSVSLSEDEGRTWPHRRPLELDTRAEGPATASYPSIIQARDGTIHVTYTYTAPAAEVRRDPQGRPLREAIKHAAFSEDWLLGQIGQ
jgi:predicted neuraminidase